jgi:hydroxyacylglutathione hydrolase
MEERLYLRQLAAGRDFALGDRVAQMMDNFVYLVGDKVTRECVVVDAAWDVQGILDVAQSDGYRLTGALGSHWHPDHVGGSMMGHDVQGLPQLLSQVSVPVYVHQADVEFVKAMTGLGDSELRPVSSGEKVKVGEVEVECLHTPGHTKGSQCFRCGQALISGDTLFMQGCGRTDLPGGDIEEMWRTLYQRLLTLPPDLVLLPGHDYGKMPPQPLSEVKRLNPVLQAPDYSTFLRMMGR